MTPGNTGATTNMKSPTTPSPISPRILSYLFTSLYYPPTHVSAPLLSNASTNSLPSPRKWHLRRILRSDNPADINAELTGIATFHPLHNNNNSNHDDGGKQKYKQMVYKEEGEMPSTVQGMAGLKWTKKYIWRLNNANNNDNTDNPENSVARSDETNGTGGLSIWFVKIKTGSERNREDHQDEADYLFHEFDLSSQQQQTTESSEIVSLEPPMPPPLKISSTLAETHPETKVIHARGDHLCVKDMYYTAYSFRIVPETGEVLSWASRHVVKGPKKNQDIINLYSIEG